MTLPDAPSLFDHDDRLQRRDHLGIVDGVNHDVRSNDNHLGRLTGMMVVG